MSRATGEEPCGYETADQHGTAFWIPEDTGDGAWFLLLLADRLQDQFFPETRGAWGEARPACPGHLLSDTPGDDGSGAQRHAG